MPQIFTDGNAVYERFAQEYIQHKKGLFILAPSGSGKTYFVSRQTQRHWIDGDDLWVACGAQPQDREWWSEGLDVIFEVDQKSDVITAEAKRLGFWIIGASNYWLTPDAIVLPEWEQHKKYIKMREEYGYDGGAKSSDFEQVLRHRSVLQELAEEKKVPVFKSVEEAVNALT